MIEVKALGRYRLTGAKRSNRSHVLFIALIYLNDISKTFKYVKCAKTFMAVGPVGNRL